MSQPPPSVPSVHAVDDEMHLLDVREPDEWDAGHAPGAVHIPLGELPGRVGELPPDRTIAITCRSGGRSSRATAYLRSLGLDAVNLEGGMQGWAAAGRPMESATGAPATVK